VDAGRRDAAAAHGLPPAVPAAGPPRASRPTAAAVLAWDVKVGAEQILKSRLDDEKQHF
jgi:hypothetical protein